MKNCITFVLAFSYEKIKPHICNIAYIRLFRDWTLFVAFVGVFMTYQEQLKSPLWQKFRLEILQRDHFRCRCCGNDKDQLHTHHLYYLPKTLLWEYDMDGVVSVCPACHEILTKELGKIAGLIAFDVLRLKISL